MKISIKKKLTLGVGIQFLLILVSVAAGLVSVGLLTTDTENILRANYNSIEYCRHIGEAVDDVDHPAAAIQAFADNLEQQRLNVTEEGEQAYTDALAQNFSAFKANTIDPTLALQIRKNLNAITGLNMAAIQRKSNVAKQTASNSNILIGTVGTLSLVIALTLLINLPSSIADPIKEFTVSIKEIAKKNYAWRIDEDRDEEFGEMAKSFNSMAAKLQDYESSSLSKMLFEKKRIEALINKMHNPIIGLNEEQVILFANDAALKILNLRAGDLVGKQAQEATKTNDLLRTLLQGQLASSATIGAAKPAALKIYADNKESFFEKEVVQVTMAPAGESTEKYIGDVIILQNITPFKELDAAKTNFIATVSHEFKTPISSIKMSLQLLQNERIGLLNEEQQSLVQSIQEDAARLLKITTALLDLTQVESGQIKLSILPVEIAEIVQYALAATKVQAEQKDVGIALAIDPHLPLVLADSEKTAWVLTNLISNAIRYSYEHATVFVDAKREGDRLRVTVRDSGQGIAPQYQGKIFERYFRVPGTAKEGTGLGLAISKEFIEAQGGSIGMTSDFGAGSTFWVDLETA